MVGLLKKVARPVMLATSKANHDCVVLICDSLNNPQLIGSATLDVSYLSVEKERRNEDELAYVKIRMSGGD